MPGYKSLPLFGAALLAMLQMSTASHADPLSQITQNGEITIGVKQYDPPFGFRNDNGALHGLEIDLANAIAGRLGVKLELVPINPTSRLQFIELGLHDALIGTLAVTDRRKEQARLVEPYYYASTVSLLIPPQSDAASLAALSGQRVCMKRGAYFEAMLAAHPADLTVQPFATMDEAMRSLLDGQCAALAGDTVTLISMHRDDSRLKSYELRRTDLEPLPWAIAINSSAAGSGLEQTLSEAVTQWHASGTLKSLEQKWLGRNTDWVLEQHQAAQ